MTNREKLIEMLTAHKNEALPFLECPPTCDDGCPTSLLGEDTEIIYCEQCQTEWLDAEWEE